MTGKQVGGKILTLNITFKESSDLSYFQFKSKKLYVYIRLIPYNYQGLLLLLALGFADMSSHPDRRWGLMLGLRIGIN